MPNLESNEAICQQFKSINPGGAQNVLLQRLKKDFEKIRHIKPPASRKESFEQYVVTTGFRG